jgi:hypothetical protein
MVALLFCLWMDKGSVTKQKPALQSGLEGRCVCSLCEAEHDYPDLGSGFLLAFFFMSGMRLRGITLPL